MLEGLGLEEIERCIAEAGAAGSGASDGRRLPDLLRRVGGAANFALFVPWFYGIRAFHVFAIVAGERFLCLTF